MDKVNHYFNLAVDKTVLFAPRVIIAILLLWIGFKVIKKLTSVIAILLEKSALSESIRPFLLSIVNICLKIALLFIIAGVLDVELSIFATIIAASVFAIGMSLQGSLGNFASGLIVLSIRPYKTNDWIQLEDKFGKVIEIGIFNTKVVTPGNKILIIPNSKITSDIVTNYSENEMIRLELELSMPYHESYPKIKQIILEALKTVPKILTEKEPEVGIINFDSHNITLAVRPYIHPDDYWELTYDCYEVIKKAFSDNDIQIAYAEGIQLGAIGN